MLGDPIGHSLSPLMHNAAFKALNMDSRYHAFKVNAQKLEVAIKGAQALGMKGINLTVPLKEKALEFVESDPLAKTIGAINTINFEEDRIRGYNTDGIGAQKALIDAGVKLKHSNVLIVGAGGASRAISFQLANSGSNVTIANRSAQRAIELAKDVASVGNVTGCGTDNLQFLIQQSDILINCTTVGMHPHSDNSIALAKDMHKGLTVFDIVYNPLETKLLSEAKKAEIPAVSGVMMLVYQGAEAFKIWTGFEPPIDIMKNAVMEALHT